MTRHDPEIEELREKAHCAVVLERTRPCWAGEFSLGPILMAQINARTRERKTA
jgi:hypothetical protein